MTRFSLWVLALSSALILSACGGSGGGSLPTSSVMEPTEIEARNAIVAISRAADRLLTTDIVVPTSSRLLPSERFAMGCFASFCSTDVFGVPVEVAAADFGVGLDADDVRQIQTVHGTPTGRIQGTETGAGVSADYTVYGGWLTDNVFGYSFTTYRAPATVDGLQSLYAFSFGTASGSNPMTGAATWTGAMVGSHQARPTQAIQGRAEAVYQFADQMLDVSMTELTRGYADMRWQNIDVQGGRFQTFAGMGSGTDYLWGSFYGANHEEVGGTFERAGIVGAFGAKR